MGLAHEKMDVYRLSVMLSRLGGRGCSLEESSAAYRAEPVAVDPDSDFDPEDEKPQQAAARKALTRVRAP